MLTLFDLSSKTAVLTRTSKGMGLAMATALAKHGAKVVISARNQDKLEVAAETINDNCSKEITLPITANTGHRTALEHLVEQAHSRAALKDIVIGNEGLTPYLGPTSEIPDPAYEKTMKTNLQSSLWLSKLTVPDMVKKRAGLDIFTASFVALKPQNILEHMECQN